MSLLMFALACGSTETSTPPPTPSATEAAPAPRAAGFETIQVADLAAMEPRPFVLDVRTPGEFAEGHIPGAVNIPLQELEARLAELESQRSGMAVVCAVGGRSKAASELLAGQGFTGVQNVDGGTTGWIAAGHPVE
jgi:phage shock protein E